MVVLLSNHQNVFLISVVVCVLCNFPFDQRAEVQKKSSSSWVKVNIVLLVSKSSSIVEMQD